MHVLLTVKCHACTYNRRQRCQGDWRCANRRGRGADVLCHGQDPSPPAFCPFLQGSIFLQSSSHCSGIIIDSWPHPWHTLPNFSVGYDTGTKFALVTDLYRPTAMIVLWLFLGSVCQRQEGKCQQFYGWNVQGCGESDGRESSGLSEVRMIILCFHRVIITRRTSYCWAYSVCTAVTTTLPT